MEKRIVWTQNGKLQEWKGIADTGDTFDIKQNERSFYILTGENFTITEVSAAKAKNAAKKRLEGTIVDFKYVLTERNHALLKHILETYEGTVDLGVLMMSFPLNMNGMQVSGHLSVFKRNLIAEINGNSVTITEYGRELFNEYIPPQPGLTKSGAPRVSPALKRFGERPAGVPDLPTELAHYKARLAQAECDLVVARGVAGLHPHSEAKQEAFARAIERVEDRKADLEIAETNSVKAAANGHPAPMLRQAIELL